MEQAALLLPSPPRNLNSRSHALPGLDTRIAMDAAGQLADAATLNSLLRSFNGPQLLAVSDTLERERLAKRAGRRR